ncbi:hypothetical protein L1987_69780 [Smallanthus sonchifolius]|uniref:Uncharacterized protein n=1 Tax=Smallanthus sonchifolius TaxID=185202 RepID=A0ACB9B6N9_9ASTR|nr:hypothetical protein L1987_69780 [Smallanthus sonchifolius]
MSDFAFTQSAKLNPDFCLYARGLMEAGLSCFGDRGVNLRSAKVCELGLLSYKAKHGNEFDSRNYPFKKNQIIFRHQVGEKNKKTISQDIKVILSSSLLNWSKA